jgi:hypothetical protein
MLSLPSLLSLIGLLQLFDLDFAHLQNGPHHPIRFLSVLVLHHLADVRGNDLPRNAEFVPESAALFGSPAFGEFLPELVYFLLRSTVCNERNGGRELEMRAAVQCEKFLPIELKQHGQHRTLGPARSRCPWFSVMGNGFNLRIPEYGSVKLHCLLGVIVEPQAWGELLHIGSFQFYFVVNVGSNAFRKIPPARLLSCSDCSA